MNSNPCCMQNPGYAGYTNGGYSWGAALWIVLFILLVIIIGAGWTGYNNND
ncbi:MAG: sporulation protein YjcZ [Bacilli bacterium]|nr:sporulation protein YjcZ [Bacilli bacterium]